MTAGPRRIAALIINWNGTDDTLELLESLIPQAGGGLGLKAFVVDNASEPEEREALRAGVEFLKDRLPIRLLLNDENLGVPAAYNQAIASAGSDFDYYLRLDNDVVLKPGAVDWLVEAIERRRNAGVRLVGGNVKYYDRPEANNGGAVRIDLLRGHTRVSYPGDEVLCDGVLGCVMLLDQEVIRRLGPEVFDSWLFLSTDESELSLRCAEEGWKTLYIPSPIALHKGGRSTNKVLSLSGLYGTRNWSFLSLRFIRPRILWPLVMARLVGTAVYLLIRGRAPVAHSITRGMLASIHRVKDVR